MKKEPNRFRGVYGGAVAAERAKELGKAKGYYEQLLLICAKAVPAGRAELLAARKAAGG